MNIFYKTKQDYSTPREFLDKVEYRFGKIKCDLAASISNHVVDKWYGPGSSICKDTFDIEWPKRGLNWLNPEYKNIEPYVTKSYTESLSGSRIALLIPAFTSTEYYARFICNKAYILFLRPRIKFDDITITCIHMMLCMYGYPPGFECWNWKEVKNYRYIQPLII